MAYRSLSPVYGNAFYGRAASPVFARGRSPVPFPRAASPAFARAASPVFRGRAVSPVAYPRAASPVFARAASPVFRGRAVSPAFARGFSPVPYARAVSPAPVVRAVSPAPVARAVSPAPYASAVAPYSFARAGTPVYGGSVCGPVVTPDVTVRHAPTVTTHLEPRVVRYDEPVTTVTEHFSTSRRIYNGYGGGYFYGHDGVVGAAAACPAGVNAVPYGFNGYAAGYGAPYYY